VIVFRKNDSPFIYLWIVGFWDGVVVCFGFVGLVFLCFGLEDD
jgi:hypothetical protein